LDFVEEFLKGEGKVLTPSFFPETRDRLKETRETNYSECTAQNYPRKKRTDEN
jgi:hypothetical protein